MLLAAAECAIAPPIVVPPRWLHLPGNDRFQVSDRGEIRKAVNATRPERRQFAPIEGARDKDGYRYVNIAGQRWRIHRLVYSLFCGELVAGLVVCHLDGNLTNNAASNLAQLTQRENISHKALHGTAQLGEKHGRALYSDALVARVKAAVFASPRTRTGRMQHGSVPALASRYGVRRSLVRDLARNRQNAWRHV